MPKASRYGYIIVNRDWIPAVQLSMAAHTFAGAAGEAWRRRVGPPENQGADFSVIVQRWNEKGYGPRKATLSLS